MGGTLACKRVSNVWTVHERDVTLANQRMTEWSYYLVRLVKHFGPDAKPKVDGLPTVAEVAVRDWLGNTHHKCESLQPPLWEPNGIQNSAFPPPSFLPFNKTLFRRRSSSSTSFIALRHLCVTVTFFLQYHCLVLYTTLFGQCPQDRVRIYWFAATHRRTHSFKTPQSR